MTLKRRQRFAKYEQTLLQCDDDLKSLQRFVAAQVVAFRKILKKYRKWTGSAALGSRFKENVLADPKSFTRRDFSQLETLHDDLSQTLHGALPPDPPGGYLPCDPEHRQLRSPSPPGSQVTPGLTEATTDCSPQPSAGYWNEYDCGSEAGDLDGHADDYAIYIDPNDDVSFPGIKALGVFISKPLHKLTGWMAFPHRKPAPGGAEHAPLLPTHRSPTATPPYGSSARSPPDLGYFSTPPGGTAHSYGAATATDTELDGEDSSRFTSHRHSRRNSGDFRNFSAGYTSSSSDDQHAHRQSFFLPSQGYTVHHAAASHSSAGYTLPSIAHQRVTRSRERVLAYATAGCFAASVVLMGIAAVLIATGRHRMRLEVDAAALVGIVSSLGAACGGLCMAGARHDSLGWVGRLAVWGVFCGVCVVNGVLLVLVMGNASGV